MKNELVNLANDCQQIDLKKANKEIVELYKEVSMLGRKMALKIFKIGELIFTISMRMTPEEYRDWLKTGLPFSEKTAKNYVKVYLHFYEKQDQLKELTIMQAYAVAGISGRNELPAPKEEDEEVLFLQEGEKIYTYGSEEDEIKAAAKKLFTHSTLSGCDLKNYRVAFSEKKEVSQLWVYTKDGEGYLAADLILIPTDEKLFNDFNSLKSTLQIEIERYLHKVETLEKGE